MRCDKVAGFTKAVVAQLVEHSHGKFCPPIGKPVGEARITVKGLSKAETVAPRARTTDKGDFIQFGYVEDTV